MCSPRLLQGRPRVRYTGLMQTVWSPRGERWDVSQTSARKNSGAIREGFLVKPSLLTGGLAPDEGEGWLTAPQAPTALSKADNDP
jgi:hypothetical protein